MNRWQFLLFPVIAVGVVSTALFSGSTVHAATCGGTDTMFIACNDQVQGGTETSGIWSVLMIALNIMTAGVGVFAVAGFVYASIMYTTAEDNASQVNKAKGIMANTTIGLISFALMYSGMQFLIPGGVFNSVAATRITTGSQNNLPDIGASGDTTSIADSPADGNDNTDDSNEVSACYTVTKLSGAKIQGRQFHKSGNQTYAFENSPAGIRYAAEHNYTSIDIDTQVTKDSVVVATHWSRPMEREEFYDPQGKIKKSTPVSEMTFAQISRLRHRDGASRIYSLEAIIALLAEHKVNLALEIKHPSPMIKQLPAITAQLNSAKVKAFMKGLATKAGMNTALAKARKLGFWTRGTEGSQDWKSREDCKA